MYAGVTHSIPIFLIFAPNIDCGYSLEPPQRGGYNVYPQSMFGAKIRKISFFFSTENFHFLRLKKSLYIALASFRNVTSSCWFSGELSLQFGLLYMDFKYALV